MNRLTIVNNTYGASKFGVRYVGSGKLLREQVCTINCKCLLVSVSVDTEYFFQGGEVLQLEALLSNIPGLCSFFLSWQ